MPGHGDVATKEIAEVTLETERLHAENFTKQKVLMFKKQGIPPEVGLQSYREGWWFLLRLKRLDGPGRDEPISQDQPILRSMELDPDTLKVFEREKAEHRLLTANPVIFQNVAQKAGKIKIQFMTPDEPGKYRFYLGIKSQDFLGADQELEIDVDVLDSSQVVRERKEEAESGDQDSEEEAEPKKDK